VELDHQSTFQSLEHSMKLTRKVVWLIVAPLAAFVAMAVVGGVFVRGEYETEQTATRSFTIDQNFTVVRKILVRRDGAKQLVTMGGGSVFRDQKWSDVGGEIDSVKLIGSDWRLELHGVLQVTTRDDYVGDQDIDLAQDVEITPDKLHSQVNLTKPAQRLRDYQMTTHFDRDAADSGTRIELVLTERILTDAPWFAHGIADRRVRASVERTLANQEAAIRKLVEENLDDVPLLPLR
jgi:hypothetical protein